MATTTIPWNDGSGDNITLTYPSASGDQTVAVSSDANTGTPRVKDVTFTVSAGETTVTRVLTVKQESVPDIVVPIYNGVYPSYNGVARGFARTLPSEYSRVSYIQYNSALIDTGEKTTDKSEIYARVYISSSSATYLWKSDSDSSLTTNTTAYASANGNWRFGSQAFAVPSSTYRSQQHEFVQSKYGIRMDGVQIGSYSGVSAFTSTANLQFGSGSAVNCNFYFFRHTKDGVTVSDYVPVVRIADSVAGMYDYIKREFKAGGTAGPAL